MLSEELRPEILTEGRCLVIKGVSFFHKNERSHSIVHSAAISEKYFVLLGSEACTSYNADLAPTN